MLNRVTILSLVERAPKMPIYPDPRFPGSLYYRFLRLLTNVVRPAVSVELGVCGGGGSLHLALGWPKGKVIGVDITNDYPDQIEHIKQQCPNFEFWQKDSEWGAFLALACGYNYGSISILFIDTVHTYKRTLKEFEAWQPLMAGDGVVVLDDLFRPGMEEAWQELPGRDKIRLDNLHPKQPKGFGGFGVILL